jgi:uncharacterized surface protein with fasciclin (FAS1) repeats
MITMKTRKNATRLAALTAAILLPLSAAACGMESDAAAPAGGTSSAPMSSPSMSAPASPSASAGSMTEPFGTACSSIPKTGKGSFDGMSQDPVATAASNNPALSTLVTAVKAAGLVDTLNTTDNITVFAPTNDAFAAVDPATLKKALGDPKGLLTDVLTAHVVAGRLSPDQLTGSGESFEVNGEAMVVCGNVQTANATVYIIDHVLLPKS